MALKLIKNGEIQSGNDPSLERLNKFCSGERDFVFEWIEGQYWLHSDQAKERPIGIEIDRELKRHEEYFKRSSIQKELLARAVGVKGPYRPRVLDLTAGMLGDSLLLLSFGCEVWAIERHPVMSFLIQSAIENARHPKIENFHFFSGEALEMLGKVPEVDSIYFDPMFEDPNEKTSPKKEMRIFRGLVGKDTDAQMVFEAARKKGPKRLIVKRPKQSIPISPDQAVEYMGKSTRYDVYFSV